MKRRALLTLGAGAAAFMCAGQTPIIALSTDGRDALAGRRPAALRLAERKLHRGRQLFGGEQEMLAIARALLLNPKLLILDEPSPGLAPLIAREVFRIVGVPKALGAAD